MPYNIGVIGTGYVGLVTGTCFAESGNQVICVDIDEAKVEKLRSGTVTIYEPGLEHIFQRNVRENRLHFTTNLEEAVLNSTLLFLCLPTPPGGDGAADLQYVLKVANDIGDILREHHISEFRILVDKSTVPVGTSDKVRTTVRQAAPDANFDVVSNPEFLREGFAVEDFLKPDRVVVGTSDPKSAEIMRELYQPFTRSGNPIFVIDERSAEVCKYAANSYLATRISFMNDLATYCEQAGANVEDVRRTMGADTRIGKRFLYPGIGYGGSCFPKDVRALIHSADGFGVDLSIITAAEDVNKRQAKRFIQRIKQRFDNNLAGKKVAVWGLAFKPNTDDTREAPAFTLIDSLLEDGATVRAYDPEAFEGTRVRYSDRITYAKDMYDAAEGADVLIIATEWSEFRNPDFARLQHALNNTIIFDGRNIFDPEQFAATVFEYHSVGRDSVTHSTENE